MLGFQLLISLTNPDMYFLITHGRVTVEYRAFLVTW